MNLFTLAALAAAVTGLVTGAKFAESSNLAFLACVLVGTLTGMLGYGLALFPGLAVTLFPHGKNAAPSKSALGGKLIFMGAFASPLLAFLVTNVVFGVLVQWYA